MKVLVDSSFLMRVIEVGSNLISKVEDKLSSKLILVTIPQVIKELENLSSSKGKKGRMARLALELCKNLERLDIQPTEEDVDLVLKKVAKSLNIPVLTCDHELKRLLRESGVSVIYVNTQGKISLEGLFI